MNNQELSNLLARVCIHTGQRADPLLFAAWKEELDPDVTYQDAIMAVTAHYREKTFPVMPADINRQVRSVQRKRLENARVLVGDAPVDPGVFPVWEKARIAALKQGLTSADAERLAWSEIGQDPPRVGSGSRRDPARLLGEIKKLTKRP